jgi:hypothetical protein
MYCSMLTSELERTGECVVACFVEILVRISSVKF